MHIDNNGVAVPVATVVMEPGTDMYEFNETLVTGFSRVIFYYQTQTANVTIVIHHFLGDRTGQVHLRSHQEMFVEYVISETNVTEAPVSYIIDYQAHIFMPTEVHLQGINTTMHGLMSGVHHLYIEDGCTAKITSTSQTAQRENETLVDLTEMGNFNLPTINVRKDGILEFRNITNYFNISAAFMELKFHGTVLMNHGYVSVGDLDVESESCFKLEGRGYGAGAGPGAGSGSGGGSYGGVGGGATDTKAYGSVFSPADLGSGGGGDGAGSGGGYILFSVGKTIHIDGTIDSYGANASGSSGGGSGGTIVVKAYNMSGLGVLDASGGDGSGSGKGGSGGRIAVQIDSTNLFAGQYLAHGGTSGDGKPQNSGGPGTIFKYESNRGPTYRELKYDPRLNATIIEPEHEKLTIENSNLQTTNPAIVMEENTLYYEFDEVQIEGYSYVHFYHPGLNEIVQVNISELTGNKKGMIRVQKNQQLKINFVEATHTFLDTPCGFHINPGGEVILPTTVVMVTEKTILGGILVGVENLIIERGAEFILDHKAATAFAADYTMGTLHTDNSTGGVFNVPLISVNNMGIFTTDVKNVIPNIQAGTLTVRKGGKFVVKPKSIHLTLSTMTVEHGGVIDGRGRGRGKEQLS